MRIHYLAVASAMALALAGCGDKTKRVANRARAPGAAAESASVAAPPSRVADVASAPAGQAAGSDDTSIETTDEKLATGQFYDAYPLDMEANTGVDLTVNSHGFKPVIIILDTAQKPISETTAVTQNPDGSWTLNAREQFEQGGRYFVIIAAEQVGATGTYTTDVQTTRVIG